MADVSCARCSRLRMDHVRATRAAAAVGQFVAILLGLIGLMGGGVMLVVIASFIFFAAGAENAEGQTRTVLASHRVGEAYNHNSLTLSPTDHVGRVVHYILNSYQPDFAASGARRGDARRRDSFAGRKNAGDVPVSDIMKSSIVRVQADQTLDEVRLAMNENSTRIAAVYDGNRYLGLISAEDIAEAFALLRFFDAQAVKEPVGREIVV